MQGANLYGVQGPDIHAQSHPITVPKGSRVGFGEMGDPKGVDIP